jgi:hypothetical protein
MGRKISPEKRIGMIGKNTYGSSMEVVEYINSSNIWVRFEKGNLVHTSMTAFCRGDVKNVYDRSVYGIGFLGEGKYKVSINQKRTPQYQTWQTMLQRCYSEKLHKRQPTYKDCYVAEEWHNFQNFAAWYDENYYEIEGEVMSLDKDILIKGNKIYSPEKCIFVPKRINSLFLKSDKSRGNLPIGVSFDINRKMYTACCTFNERNVHYGLYDSPEEAFKSL